MELEQKVREGLREIENKIKVETRNSYPDTTQFTKDIIYTNRFLENKNIPKPTEKQINSITKVIELLTNYMGEFLKQAYIDETKELNSTGAFEKSITSGTQIPPLKVLDKLLGEELKAINNSIELEDDFYMITERAKNEDAKKNKNLGIIERIKEIYLSKGRMSQIGTLNSLGGLLSTLGVAYLINYIPELREQFGAHMNNLDLAKDIVLLAIPATMAGAGYYMSTKAKDTGNKVKEIFKDINKILPKIKKKKREDQYSSIDKLNKYSYWGSFLASIGLLGTAIYGKEIHDAVTNSGDNAEAIRYAISLITSIPIATYGSYLFKKSMDLTKKIDLEFRNATRFDIRDAYVKRLVELEQEGLLRFPANFTRESNIHKPTEIRQPINPDKTPNLIEILERFGYKPYDREFGESQSEIGRGGFGKVLLCYDKRKAVAIKVLSPRITNDKSMIPTRRGMRKKSEVAIESFEREFDYQKRLSGCSLVPVAEELIKIDARSNLLEEGNSQNVEHMAIVMEYIRGPTIKYITDFLRDNSTRLDDNREVKGKNEVFVPAYFAKHIAKQMSSGLQEIHDDGIIHKDIKPGNVMIEHNGEVKILDFGIAQRVNDDSYEKIIELDTNAVSPLYSSPEQIRSELGGRLSFNSDIHQFGQVLYQLLTNENPFINDDVLVRETGIKQRIGLGDYNIEDPIDDEKERKKILDGIDKSKVLSDEDKTNLKIRYNNVLDGYYKLPRKINPSISKEMEDIIIDCLKLNPEDRKYKTMRDVDEALDRIDIYGHKKEIKLFVEKVYSKFPAKLRC